MRTSTSPREGGSKRSSAGMRGLFRSAFSLIEVNMAILVVAGGLLTLFALFPAGLRQSTMALADMRQSMFANEVLSGIQANAQKIDGIVEWNDPARFWTECRKGVLDGKLPETLSSKVGEVYISEIIEIPQFFVAVPREGGGGDAGLYVKAPVRFKIRLNRKGPGGAPRVPSNPPKGLYRQVINARDGHLDMTTWRVSLVSVDQPDLIFDHNPVYHLELRFSGAKP